MHQGVATASTKRRHGLYFAAASCAWMLLLAARSASAFLTTTITSQHAPAGFLSSVFPRRHAQRFMAASITGGGPRVYEEGQVREGRGGWDN